MKDNKLYKVLRIIFLTLAILSMVFSLSKKFVHAASSDSSPIVINSYPLPFGSGQGTDNINFDQSIVEELNRQFSSSESNGTMRYIFLYEVIDSDTYDIITINDTSNTHLYVSHQGTFPQSTVTVGGWLVKWHVTSNGVTFYEYSSSSIGMNINNYLTSSPSGGYTLRTGNLLYYPLWSYQDLPISDGSQDYFAYSGSGGGSFDGPGFGNGTISGQVTDYEGHGFDYDLDISIDLNPLEVLGEEIKDKLDYFKDRVVEGFGVIGGKIDTFKDRVVEGFGVVGSIPGKVQALYDYITESFDEDKFSEKFQEMELGQELTTFRTDIESFTGIFNVSPAAAEDVRFSIPFTLPYVNQNLQAVIDFSFYDRIRSIVVPFFTVFLIFGMVWSLIRSIPGILHGTSPDGDS